MKILETNIENTFFTNEKFYIDYFDYGYKFLYYDYVRDFMMKRSQL